MISERVGTASLTIKIGSGMEAKGGRGRGSNLSRQSLQKVDIHLHTKAANPCFQLCPIGRHPTCRNSRGQTVPAGLLPFNDFLRGVSSAQFETYASPARNGVKTAESFEEMRRHILSLYEGVTVIPKALLADS